MQLLKEIYLMFDKNNILTSYKNLQKKIYLQKLRCYLNWGKSILSKILFVACVAIDFVHF